MRATVIFAALLAALIIGASFGKEGSFERMLRGPAPATYRIAH